MSETLEHPVAPDLDLDEACRLLDGAVSLLARMAEDPRVLRERAATSLIDEMRSWGSSAPPSFPGTDPEPMG